jgi:hypothetical protein
MNPRWWLGGLALSVIAVASANGEVVKGVMEVTGAEMS